MNFCLCVLSKQIHLRRGWRTLLVINSDLDPHTPLAVVSEFTNVAHQVKPESERAAIEWFVKWLKP